MKKRPGLWRRVSEEVRGKPMAYGVLFVFALLGPVVTSVVFPEAPLAVGLAGGLAFGVWAAFCAVPGEFF